MSKGIFSLINTFVLSTVLLILFFVISFNVTNALVGEKNENLIKLSLEDKNVVTVIDLLNKYDYFRSSYVDKDKIDNLTMLKFIFDNLEDKDYEIKYVTPVKITCSVNNNIRFTNNGRCKVLKIKNKKIDGYRKLLFDYDKVFSFVDFEYKGLNCKNDGKSYYCLIRNYEEVSKDFKGYSFIESAYRSDDKIILYEYYLVDYLDYESCSKYYGELYCTDDYDGNLPKIKNDIIKKYGVYYRHEFKFKDDKIYLDKSFIVNE